MLALSQLRALLIALLILSIGIKVAARSHQLYADAETETVQQAERRDVVDFFRHHGFRVERDESEPEASVIPALAGECRMLIVLASPQGWKQDVVRQLATPEDQTFFVYNGGRYREQPVWRTLIDYYWRKLYHYVGVKLPPSPLLSIAASPACELSRMPWQEVAHLRPPATPEP